MLIFQNSIGNDYLEIATLVKPLWEKYCLNFGYTFIQTSIHDPIKLTPNWSKLTLLIKYLKENSIVCSVDTDMYPVDFTTPIPNIDTKLGLVVPKIKWFKYNTGFILANSSPELINWLQKCLDLGPIEKQYLPGEQTRMCNLIDEVSVTELDNKFNCYKNTPSDKPVFKAFHGDSLKSLIDYVQTTNK